MVVVTMLIPVKSNEGRTFTAQHHAAFEAAAVEIVGGFTRQPNTAKGGWRSDAGETYIEFHYSYAFGVASLILESGKVLELANFAKAHYQQLAINVSYLGETENL